MADKRRRNAYGSLLAAGVLALSGCSPAPRPDFRHTTGGFSTAYPSVPAADRRPLPDRRGVISYANFQVAVARENDTVKSVAERLGVNAFRLARYNGIGPNHRLRPGSILTLPDRVAETSPATGPIDITSLAGNALDRAEAGQRSHPFETKPIPPQTGNEPIQHRVVRGETAYTIARQYEVPVRSLADWNGLGPGLRLREGQYLLIPTKRNAGAAASLDTVVTLPGVGSPTPEPPSASTPLPNENPERSAAAPPSSPELSTQRTAASEPRLLLPVDGAIIRGYEKGKNDGIELAGTPGTPVRAADDGVVATITRDTDAIPIMVIRHEGGLLTVYANIDNIKFEKDQRVKRGQAIAEIRNASPAFLHFEVRQGFDSVDPIPYLN